MSTESAYTSLAQNLPAVYKRFNLTDGDVLELGCGKATKAKEFVENTNHEYFGYDPNHKNDGENAVALSTAAIVGTDYITIPNVLNVIKDEKERLELLHLTRSLFNSMVESVGKSPTIYIQIYEGNQSGTQSKTTSQNNFKTSVYLPMVEKVFDDCMVSKTSNYIIVM